MLSNVTMDVNNCTNSTNISLSVEEYLQHLQDKTNITMIPATIFMSILACCGLVGNVLVLLVYSHKMKLNPTKVLLMTIASFDLVANLGAIPSEINIMFNTWNFSNRGVCKSKVFLGAFSTGGGAVSLLIVAFIRYRKVCTPYNWQVSVGQAKVASVISVLVAFVLSLPYVIIYGIKTRDTSCTKIKGYECFADDYYHDTIWPFMNNLLFAFTYFGLAVSLVIFYSLIGALAWRQSKKWEILGGTKVRKRNVNSANIAELSPDTQPENLSSTASVHQHGLVCGKMQFLLCCLQRLTQKNYDDEDHSSSPLEMKIATSSLTESEIEENNQQLDSSEVKVKTSIKPASCLILQVPLDTDVRQTPELSNPKSVQVLSQTNATHEVYRTEEAIVEDHRDNSQQSVNVEKTGNVDFSEDRLLQEKHLVDVNTFSFMSSDITEASYTSSDIKPTPPNTSEMIPTSHKSSDIKPTPPNTSEMILTSQMPFEMTLTSRRPSEMTETSRRPSEMTLTSRRPSEMTETSRRPSETTQTTRRPMNRMTVMLILISAIFVLSYLPFLILTVYKLKLPEQYFNLNTVEFSFYNLFYRMYFLNSAANPIIYSLCDINFRRECIRLLTCRSSRELWRKQMV